MTDILKSNTIFEKRNLVGGWNPKPVFKNHWPADTGNHRSCNSLFTLLSLFSGIFFFFNMAISTGQILEDDAS